MIYFLFCVDVFAMLLRFHLCFFRFYYLFEIYQVVSLFSFLLSFNRHAFFLVSIPPRISSDGFKVCHDKEVCVPNFGSLLKIQHLTTMILFATPCLRCNSKYKTVQVSECSPLCNPTRLLQTENFA